MIFRIVVSKYGKHPVYSDGGTWYPGLQGNDIEVLSTFTVGEYDRKSNAVFQGKN